MRRDEIVPIVMQVLADVAARGSRPPLRLEPDAIAALTAHDYPGNIRELRGCVERAAVMASGESLSRLDLKFENALLSPESRWARTHAENASHQLGRPPTLDELERDYMLWLLDRANGNWTQVARLMGVSYPTVARKRRVYGLAT